MGGRWLVAAVAAVALATVSGARMAARGQDRPGEPRGGTATPSEPGVSMTQDRVVLDGLDRVIRKLHANDGALRLGATPKAALKACPGSAAMMTEYLVPLAGSFLDPDRTLRGSIRWSYDGKGSSARVDAIQVVILSGTVDREAMRSTLKAAGKAVGLILDTSEDRPDTWFDFEAKDTDIWVAVGDGVVAVDADPAD